MITTIRKNKKDVAISNYKPELANKINCFQEKLEARGMKVLTARFGGSDYHGNFDAIIFTVEGRKGAAEIRRPAMVVNWKDVTAVTAVTDTDIFKIKI